MNGQPSMFDGVTAEAHDDARLLTQLERVERVMSSGWWMTLAEIAGRVGAPEGSVSARIRDLRKARFGSHVIDRRRLAQHGGTWEYRMSPNTDAEISAHYGGTQ